MNGPDLSCNLRSYIRAQAKVISRMAMELHKAQVPGYIDEQSAAEAGLLDFDVMTCSGCLAAETCTYAWDSYNTDGDCLASK